MKHSHWAGILLLYAMFLAAAAPASILLWAANRHFSPYTITAESCSGTLWHGEARGMVLAAKNKQDLHLGQATWSLNLFWLLSGKLSADLTLTGNGANGHGNVVLGRNSVGLRQLDLAIPAASLAYLDPLLGMWSLEGIVHIRSNELLLQPGNNQGKGEATWEQAGISLSKINPIGTYHVTFSGTGEEIQILLQSQSGALELSGKGSWSQPAGFKFRGSAKALEHEPELRRLLGLIGKPNQDNSYTIQF